MTFTGSPRTSTAHWRRLRRLVLERDGHRCVLPDCPYLDDPLEVDHIVRPDQGGTDDPTNLRTLCLTHHRRKTSAEGRAARLKLARPAEKHPGLR